MKTCRLAANALLSLSWAAGVFFMFVSAVQAQAAPPNATSARTGILKSDTHVGAGARVTQAIPGAPANQAGVRPSDEMAPADGTSASSPQQSQAIVTRHRAGDAVNLSIVRGRWKINIPLVTISPAEAGKSPQIHEAFKPTPTGARAYSIPPRAQSDRPAGENDAHDP